MMRDGCDTGCGRRRGRRRGARLGVDGCGRGCGWKMEGSETGCGRVWTRVCKEDEETGVRMEDEGEQDLRMKARLGVGRGVDGRWRGARLGVERCGRVWMEDGGEREWVRTGVDGGLDGRRGERDWCGAVWTGAWMEHEGERCGAVWTGTDGRRRERDWVWMGGWKMERSETGRERKCGGGARNWAWTGVDAGADEGAGEWMEGCEEFLAALMAPMA